MSKQTQSKIRDRLSQKYLDSLIIKPKEETVKVVQVERAPVAPKPILHSKEEYDTMHPEETIRNFVSSIKEMISRFEYNKDRLSELESEMQDILHYIEMGKDKDIQKGYKLYKRLSEVRKERRQMKNELDLLQPVYELFHATPLMSQIANVQGECKKMKQIIDSRCYNVRTDVLEEFVSEQAS